MGTFVKTKTINMSLTIHHYLPFLLLFMLVLSVVKSFLVSYAGKDLCLDKCKILSITMILAHLQLVFGIILFYKKSSEILNIPGIDKVFAERYEQKIEDIRKWMEITSWSQHQISEEDLEEVQQQLLKLDLISNTIDSSCILYNL